MAVKPPLLRRAGDLVAGVLFGAGMLLSGMTSPSKVVGFLDVTGHWDPSLAFVMGGGLLTAMPFYVAGRRREKAFDGTRFSEPPRTGIDRWLVGGAALFGLGWGLAGLCPGPALVALALHPALAAAFVVPMLAGLLLSRRD